MSSAAFGFPSPKVAAAINPRRSVVSNNDVNAVNNVVPLSQTSPEKIEAIRAWGRERAVPASGKPIGEEKVTMFDGVKRMRKVLI